MTFFREGLVVTPIYLIGETEKILSMMAFIPREASMRKGTILNMVVTITAEQI